MDLNENIRNTIQRLRRERNITQDILAEALEISVQAVSKWETGVSLPDIMQLPRIAKFFGVSIDYLFFNDNKEQVSLVMTELPDDNVLRIIQCRGRKVQGCNEWEKDKSINIILPKESVENLDKVLNLEVWGNANMEGNIGGYIQCGGNLNCGNIGSYANAGGNINCSNIGGAVECGGALTTSGNIGGSVECGGNLNCSSVGGSAESGGDLQCEDIGGSAECGGDLNCVEIGSSAQCSGNISCKVIKGNVQCEGDIIYEK